MGVNFIKNNLILIIYNKKSLVTGWMEGWMDGWMDGWIGRKKPFKSKSNKYITNRLNNSLQDKSFQSQTFLIAVSNP